MSTPRHQDLPGERPEHGPVSFAKGAAVPPAVTFPAPPPAEFEVGDPGSGPAAAMLARYLIGRALAERLSLSLYLIGGLIIALAVGVWFPGPHWFAVLIGLVGLLVIGVRAVIMAVLRRVMAVGRLGAAEARIRALVADTGSDLRRELRRIGLPGSVFGLPLLIIRLLGRNRGATVRKLAEFEVGNVVSRSRRAELEFIVTHDVLRRASTGRRR